MNTSNFGFKELTVWKRALDFADKVIELSETLNTNNKHFRLIEQIEAASASIAQNIAEGKGRYSKKEFKQFLYYSRGSLYETVTLLNLFALRHWINSEQLSEMENDADEIGKMLNGLINSIKEQGLARSSQGIVRSSQEIVLSSQQLGNSSQGLAISF